ncbi:extracellular solute-binding protein [Caloranaerobacter ferrireducens]|uniref:extracellular solute-binding protein n=1 Tax=Caloranaerobacter ferrireducens TaxID=1323370 RepID=UPI00084D7FF3|nr:extracellular solute-binding protein [Caloranaerobacter ferrireducens]
MYKNLKRLSFAIMILLIIGIYININKNANMMSFQDDAKSEITIVVWNKVLETEIPSFISILDYYIPKFKEENNVEVRYEIVYANTYEDYIRKRNLKLYQKNGPTLIPIVRNEINEKILERYVKSGVALELTDKISYLSKIYDGLKEEKVYYVPIGMSYTAMVLNKNLLDELVIEEPNFDWTKEDYLSIKERWLSLEPRHFTKRDYIDIVKGPLYELKLIDDNNRIKLNTLEVKNFIKNARSKIFSDSYILNKDFSYEDYYKIFVEGIVTPEWEKAMRFYKGIERECLVLTLGVNIFETQQISEKIDKGNVSILPEVIKGNNIFYTWGFIVNKHGKNVEKGIEFVNGLLNDDIQFLMYNDGALTGGFYPVNKDIQNKIEKLDIKYSYNEKAVKLKMYILYRLRKCNIKPYSLDTIAQRELYDMIHKDLFKFIFTDEPYSDEKLSRELQKLEDKLNMWLNE